MAPHILNIGTWWRWVAWVISRPVYARGKSPSIHWAGGWVGPRPVRIIWEKKNFCLLSESNLTFHTELLSICHLRKTVKWVRNFLFF